MAESIRGKVIRDLIARFSNDLLIGKKIKSGELRKKSCGFRTGVEMSGAVYQYHDPYGKFYHGAVRAGGKCGQPGGAAASWRRIYCHDEECIPFVCGTLQ